MQTIKKYIMVFLGSILSLINFIYFLIFLKTKEKIVVFDIDNTLALSDPFIYNKQCTISNVPVNESMKNILLEEKLKNHKVYYLSHRPFYQLFETFFWIKNNISNKLNLSDVILVSKVHHKLSFLELFVSKSTTKISYYDDLHYGFEVFNGPFAHDDVIYKVKKLNLDYYDFNYIQTHEKYNKNCD